MKYSVIKRTVNYDTKDGHHRIWESEGFYISYYIDRRKIYEPILDDDGKPVCDYSIAKKLAEQRINAIANKSLVSFLERNRWFDPLNNPLYKDAQNSATNYHYEFAQSKRNAKCLDVVFHQFKDPIGLCCYYDIKKKDISDFKQRLMDRDFYVDGFGNPREITNTFRNNCFVAISSIYSYYVRNGSSAITENLFKNAEKFKTNYDMKKYVYKPKEIFFMFNRDLMNKIQPRTTYKDMKHGIERKLSKEKFDWIVNSVFFDLYKFIAYTGLRSNEACALTIDKFDPLYEGRVVLIDTAFKSNVCSKDTKKARGNIKILGGTKTNEPRTIVLCDPAYEIFKRLSEGKKGSDFLFTDENGDHIYTNYREAVFRVFITEIAEQFKLQKTEKEEFTIHGFRTSFNTNILMSTNLAESPRESLVASFLGWSSQSLTKTQGRHYTNYSIPDLCLVARTIQKIYDGTDMVWVDRSDKPEQTLEDIVANIMRS